MRISIFVVIFFASLIFRLFQLKSESHRDRIILYFFFFLYLFLFYQFVKYPEVPEDVYGLNIAFFAAGTTWLWADFFWQKQALRRKFKKNIKLLKKRKGPLHEIVMACQILSQARMGALMLLERKTALTKWHDKGIPLQAKVSQDLLFSIFTPPGSLHDGGVLISGDQILAAAVIVPLTHDSDFRKDLGTRHRAGLGFSEIADALCIIVSEETGKISLADKGEIYYDISLDRLGEAIVLGLQSKLKRNKKRFPAL